jgi:hypothetical protein
MTDVSQFVGSMLGAFLATLPAQAGVVCDRQGFCVAQPQFQQPYPVPPRVIIQSVSPPTPSNCPAPPQPDALGLQAKQEILAFCQQYPGKYFCGTLEAYLQKHPDAR